MNEPRKRTRAEERIAELDTSPTALAEQVEELRGAGCAAEQEAAENKQGWQRTAADFANYKRRTDQDRELMIGLANEVLLAKLLTIADDFDRAMEHMPDDLGGTGWVEGIAGHRSKAALAAGLGRPDAHRGAGQAVRSAPA